MTAVRAPVGAYMVDLHDLTHADLPQAGHKAAVLGELKRAGFSVPDGTVLTVEAFEAFLAANGFADDATPAAVEAAPIPGDIEDAIRAVAEALGPTPLAVRSSAVEPLLSPPAASSSRSNSPSFTFFEPSNMMCSKRCANPVRPGFSRAEPT